ncbi:hypothetical protein LSH36_165g05037 [Paralvinella palmiformis]|uniref:IkappaB kinase n=1 Tax=Paralvinella palmiformis TaxID=53620 RepID=A0AAD9N8A3_9ANNE|nr:hypothetical protein LSH36_165g05037 [Paralvinella palmiformis]
MRSNLGDPSCEEVRRGPWLRQKVMGKGAFGSVTLWRNKETNDDLCIKQCHALELSSKHKEQWQKECTIMLKLRHPNVVQGLPTPPELEPDSLEIPVLALEYCEGGDLRRVLNRPENCCGLPEQQVRAITKDTSMAIEYLHKQKIVHRDLKPENIVLKPLGNNKFQYKLIDLGYAKDVSAGSICRSFVGTEQYLAPELFTTANYPGQHYNSNVDYWCLGTTVFECIVGFRPFFHGVPAVQWLQYVCNKKPDHICGIFNLENNVVFSSSIPSPHFLCRYSTHVFEQWLRLMLMYDSNHRGGEMTADRPVCFEFLQTILNTKVLHIYHALDNRVLSYKVLEQTLLEILNQIRQDSKIPLPAEVFLTVNGDVLPNDYQAKNCCGSEDEENLLFLIPEATFNFSYRKRSEPELVRYMLYQPSKQTCIPFDILKRGYSHFVYYIKELNHDYQRLLQVVKAVSINMMNKKKELTKENNNMFVTVIKLQMSVNFFNISISVDLDKLRSINSSDDKILNYWNQTRGKVAEFDKLQEDVQELWEQCTRLELRADTIVKSLRVNEHFGLQWEDEIIKIYEKIRKTPKEEREKQVHDNSEIIKYTMDFMKECDQQMTSAYQQIQNVLACKTNITQFLLHVKELQDRLNQAHEKIIAFQKQRQFDIWSLLNKMSQTVGTSETNIYTQGSRFVDIPHTFAVPAVPPLTVTAFATQQASMSSVQSNNSMVIEMSTQDSVSLRNESLSNIKRITKFATTVEKSLKDNPIVPNWSYLDQESDHMID